MTNKITEDAVELLAIDLLEEQDYDYIFAPTIAPDSDFPERQSFSDVVLIDRLRNAIDTINPDIPLDAREQALKEVLNLPSQDLVVNNEAFHLMLADGIEVEYNVDGNLKGGKVWLVDYDDLNENDFLVCNQFTVIEENTNKRPDIVIFVNGLPLVVIELKNAADENATVKKAYTQLQNYKNAVPSLFYYNSLLVASDGFDAKVGSLTSGWSRFHAWKSIDGKVESSSTTPQMETLIRGMLRKDVLIDLIRHFTVFEKFKKEDTETGITTVTTEKKIAAYHQYYAVNKAIISTKKAVSGDDGKGGVVWHTQGSGKSLSMVFYAGKLVLGLDNPTIVLLTDRNDLDDQLFDTFASSKQLLRQTPVQAENREQLRDLLKVNAGGVVFTTIQKFSPKEDEHFYPLLSDRKNIIVIADEAHRSQYGFSAKTIYITDENGKDVGTRTAYGFAKYMRDALPKATFIGFTGTPVEKEDANTLTVFGDYIDIYDVERAVDDGATVRIYYESRLAKIKLNEELVEKIDEEVKGVEEESAEYQVEYSKTKWSRLEAIVGNKERLQSIASDIVNHFSEREQANDGKAMIVAMSRRIAVELYSEIIKLKPEWHDTDKNKGVIKVVMTSSSSDPESWQIHNTSKQDRKELGFRLKDPKDSLKLVIVRDMWLTGFDAPCLNTLYIDKPMKGHNLMQAIARVNRVYKDKDGGLIVDYIGIASDLKKALVIYTESGGKGKPTFDQEEAVLLMLEKHEVVSQMFNGFGYKKYFTADTSEKLHTILEAHEHVLSIDDGKDRFVKEVTALSKAFSLSVPDPRALGIKDEVGFFQAVKARFQKFEDSGGGGKSDAEVDTAIKQILDEAIISEGVVDIFDATGIKKPDLSILSDEFLEEIKDIKYKNLAIELLKKLLNEEIRNRAKKNMMQSKRFSEMITNAINKYNNKALTSAEVIEELIRLAKEMNEASKKGKDLGLTDDESAFYDALEANDSAVKIIGDEKLKELAHALVEQVKANTSIDWTIRESVRSKLKVIVKRLLRKYGYPPDKQKMAVDRILQQSEMFAESWTSG